MHLYDDDDCSTCYTHNSYHKTQQVVVTYCRNAQQWLLLVVVVVNDSVSL